MKLIELMTDMLSQSLFLIKVLMVGFGIILATTGVSALFAFTSSNKNLTDSPETA